MAQTMRRRDFIKILAGSAAAPSIARAQQNERKRLIGVLMSYAEGDSVAQAMVATFRDGLTKLDWTEGSNLRTEVRWGAGSADKFKVLAKELVSLRPEVILCQGTVATKLLLSESQTIPIVFVNVADPIGSGFVGNLAHPGGNITGFMLDVFSQGGKWVQLLKEIAPRTTHVALLSNPATGPSSQFYMPSIQAAASSAAVAVSTEPVQAKEEIEAVIAAQAREPGGGLITLPSAFGSVNRDLIVALAAQYSLPAIYYERKFTDLGGLMAYSPDYPEQFRPAADYIDRILKGAKPSELPVQAPTKYELFINLKTAKTLGLEVPPTLLARADAVIE
jgi:putative ABC transport system substrate-binding protein